MILVLSLLLLLVAPCWGDGFSNSSGDLTADSLVLIGDGSFYGIGLVTDGTNAVTVSVYDNVANSGKLLFPTFVVNGSIGTQTLNINPPVKFSNGLFVDITCAGTVHYNVYYSR